MAGWHGACSFGVALEKGSLITQCRAVSIDGSRYRDIIARVDVSYSVGDMLASRYPHAALAFGKPDYISHFVVVLKTE